MRSLARLLLSLCVGLALSVPAIADAQNLLHARDPVEPPYLRLALALLLGTFVAIIAALALKRFMSGTIELPRRLGPRAWLGVGSREVVVHETHRVSIHADVCRIGWAGRQYLVLVANGAVTVLREIEEASPERTP